MKPPKNEAKHTGMVHSVRVQCVDTGMVERSLKCVEFVSEGVEFGSETPKGKGSIHKVRCTSVRVQCIDTGSQPRLGTDVREKRDENPYGWIRCCRKNHNSLQAQAW